MGSRKRETEGGCEDAHEEKTIELLSGVDEEKEMELTPGLSLRGNEEKETELNLGLSLEGDEKKEIELSLGLSLGGRLGVENKLMRSSSIAKCLPVLKNKDDVSGSLQPPVGYSRLVRTTSLSLGTDEELRKRKEWQTFRRMNSKRRISEKSPADKMMDTLSLSLDMMKTHPLSLDGKDIGVQGSGHNDKGKGVEGGGSCFILDNKSLQSGGMQEKLSGKDKDKEGVQELGEPRKDKDKEGVQESGDKDKEGVQESGDKDKEGVQESGEPKKDKEDKGKEVQESGQKLSREYVESEKERSSFQLDNRSLQTSNRCGEIGLNNEDVVSSFENSTLSSDMTKNQVEETRTNVIEDLPCVLKEGDGLNQNVGSSSGIQINANNISSTTNAMESNITSQAMEDMSCVSLKRDGANQEVGSSSCEGSNQEVGSSSIMEIKENITPSTDVVKNLSNQSDMTRNQAGETMKNTMEDMPGVYTIGDGPNGRRVDGILYKYGRKKEVCIMCVCHGSFYSAAGFVKHAGGTNISHPLKHITVNQNCTPLI